MSVIVGYLTSLTILFWSLDSISQFLGSRDELSRRLKQAGNEFLSDLGETEMKTKSIQNMTNIMTNITNTFMEDISKIDVRIPQLFTEEEIRNSIVSSMGVRTTPSEIEVMSYLKDAVEFVKKSENKG